MLYSKQKLLALILFVCPLSIFAQTNGLAFPTANNTFLGAASDVGSPSGIGVDLYTGTAQVNIPICNVSTKGQAIPVSLSYIGARGIRVQDYASFVGLGWQMNAGGSISRVVRCFPDEIGNGYLGTGQWGSVVAGWVLSNTAPTNSQFTALTGIPTSGTNIVWGPPTADGEPDIYNVKTPFFSLQFSFDEHGNPVFSNATGMQIITHNFYNTYSYASSSFEVIDDQGNQYYFGSTSASVENTTTSLFGTNYTFPTTWYLDKIVTYNATDSVSFNYTTGPSSDVFNHYYGTLTTDQLGNINYDTTHPFSSTVSERYLSSIVTLNGEADFTYLFGRSDDPNGAMLQNIVLKGYNSQGQINTTLQTFNFNYSYFGTPSSDANVLRLRLDNITVTGNTAATSSPLLVKTFTYNTANTMPTRKSLSVADYWGYLHYIPSESYANFPYNDKTPYLPAAQTDILTSVTDLTGGTWNLYYELNDYFNSTTSANVQIGGLRVKKIIQTLPTGDTLTRLYTYTNASGQSSGQVLSNSYSLTSIAHTITLQNNTNDKITEYFSESPSEYDDINGDFFGYSSVKATEPNGGYTISQFSNYSDFPDTLKYATGITQNTTPDVTSGISYMHKRGLLTDQIVYNAAGNKITEDASPLATSYVSLTSPVTKKSAGYKWDILFLNVNSSTVGTVTYEFPSSYWKVVENYRLSQAVHYDYDQVTPTRYVQTVTNFTYCPNNRQIRSKSTTDSKSHTHTQTFYHADDTSIPLVTASEQTALTAMLAANRSGVAVHEVDNKNGIIHEDHNSYTAFPIGAATKTYATTVSSYVTASRNLVKQTTFNYDMQSGNLLSTGEINGKITGFAYAYNNAIQVAKAVNATSTASYASVPASQNASLTMPPNTWGAQTITFATFATGTITVSLPSGSYLGGPGGVTCFFNFSLSGAGSGSGSLCNSSVTGYTCSAPNSVSFSNMPAGNYTLSVNASTNTATSSAFVNVNYTGYTVNRTSSAEFFYEGFEEYPGAVFTASHTGKASYTYGYSVPYTLPNARSYVIEWWVLTGGVWVFNEQPYTGPITLTGQIDDVRIFPVDAQMITNTFAPMVGPTSVTDASGHSEYYQYDGLNRKNLILDNELNIEKALDYGYQQPAGKLTVNLVNSTTYPAGITTATIDNVAYSFPGPGVNTQLPITLTAGSHTIQLSYGPSNCYLINGTAYAAAQTNPAISLNISSNLVINYVTTCTITSSATGNLTSDASNTTACSCTGCQYTSTVYFSGTAIGAGTQLYTDAALTQKVTGKTWFRSYTTNSTYTWPLNSTGLITGNSTPCP